MHKVLTLGFVNAEIFRHTVATNSKYICGNEWHFLYQHYPLNKEKNRVELEQICKDHGIIWHDSLYDRGLHHGFNFIFPQLKFERGEYLIGIDPDDMLADESFIPAATSALDKYSQLCMVCADFKTNLITPGVNWSIQDNGEHGIIAVPDRPIMQQITVFRPEWLTNIGGMMQPTSHYGFAEGHLWRGMQKYETFMAVAVGKNQQRGQPPHDPEYIAYKADQVTFKSKDSFEKWLGSR